MIRILVTGAGGQLGREFHALREAFPGLQLSFADRHTLDLAAPGGIEQVITPGAYDLCINCAAYTAVDRAESEPAAAALINERAVGRLATACAQAGTGLIHFSSDYVYHNDWNTPLTETAPTTPRSVYARTKLAGEEALRQSGARYLILRTSWVYSSFGHNFVKTMLRLGRERDTLQVVYDQIGAPTYARDLAAAVLAIVTQDPHLPNRTFNYSNEGVCSWYDFALAIFRIKGIDCRVMPIRSAAYPTPAARPPFSLLDKSAIKTDFGLEIPHWEASLVRCLGLL